MSVLTQVFSKTAAAARFAVDAISGELITRATYGFDDSKVTHDAERAVLHDKDGTIITDYEDRNKAMALGVSIGAFPAMLCGVIATVGGGLPAAAAAGAIALGAPALFMNAQAGIDALLYKTGQAANAFTRHANPAPDAAPIDDTLQKTGVTAAQSYVTLGMLGMR